METQPPNTRQELSYRNFFKLFFGDPPFDNALTARSAVGWYRFLKHCIVEEKTCDPFEVRCPDSVGVVHHFYCLCCDIFIQIVALMFTVVN